MLTLLALAILAAPVVVPAFTGQSGS